jgi:hypothetical protein
MAWKYIDEKRQVIDIGRSQLAWKKKAKVCSAFFFFWGKVCSALSPQGVTFAGLSAFGRNLPFPRAYPSHNPSDICWKSLQWTAFDLPSLQQATFEFSKWRLVICDGISEGLPLCYMPRVFLGIFPGNFPRGYKPLSKSLAKGNVSCSASSHNNPSMYRNSKIVPDCTLC